VIAPTQLIVANWEYHLFRTAFCYERLPETLSGLHYMAFAILVLKDVAEMLT
jgi:hypothetical protein